MSVRIENWALVHEPYAPPEIQHLRGDVDGRTVLTSTVVELDLHGRRAKTARGTEYLLGVPEAGFVAWLKEHGFPSGQTLEPTN